MMVFDYVMAKTGCQADRIGFAPCRRNAPLHWHAQRIAYPDQAYDLCRYHGDLTRKAASWRVTPIEEGKSP